MSKKTSSKIPKLPRILSLDLMRGWFMIVIILNHLSFFPNGYALISADSRLFVSAAEGFFIVSGIVLGIVRGWKLRDEAMSVVTKKLWWRALTLYLASAVITLASIFISWQFIGNEGVKSPIPPRESNIFEVIWKVLTFQQLYGWVDYLYLYVVFLLIAPGFIWLLRRNKWYIGIGICLLVWAIAPRPITEHTQPFTWQLLFFIALTIGYYLENIHNWWHKLAISKRKAIKRSVLITFVVTIGANVLSEFLTPALHDPISRAITDAHAWLVPWLYKLDMSLWRIGLSFLWFLGFFFVFRRFESQIVRFFGWILLPFGMNSLYVYCVHAFFVIFMHLLVNPQYGTSPTYLTSFERLADIPLNFMLSTAVIAGIYLCVRSKLLFNIIPR